MRLNELIGTQEDYIEHLVIGIQVGVAGVIAIMPYTADRGLEETTIETHSA